MRGTIRRYNLAISMNPATMKTEERRKLAAIMFTDIVGYSSMMLENESLGREVRKLHRSIFQDHTTNHHGKIIQYYGDGTLSMFDSAVTAVACAVSMQRAFVQADIPIRIGIHLGDIMYDDTEIFGHGVNVAARIEPLCHPGGILISDKVRDELVNHNIGECVSMGTFRFQKLNQEHQLYALSSKGIVVPGKNDRLRMQELAMKMESKDQQTKWSGSSISSIVNDKRVPSLKQMLTSAFLIGMGFILGQGFYSPENTGIPQEAMAVAVLPVNTTDTTSEALCLSNHIEKEIMLHLSDYEVEGIQMETENPGLPNSVEKDVHKIVPYLLENTLEAKKQSISVRNRLIDPNGREQVWSKEYDWSTDRDYQGKIGVDIVGRIASKLGLLQTTGTKQAGENLLACNLVYPK